MVPSGMRRPAINMAIRPVWYKAEGSTQTAPTADKGSFPLGPSCCGGDPGQSLLAVEPITMIEASKPPGSKKVPTSLSRRIQHGDDHSSATPKNHPMTGRNTPPTSNSGSAAISLTPTRGRRSAWVASASASIRPPYLSPPSVRARVGCRRCPRSRRQLQLLTERRLPPDSVPMFLTSLGTRRHNVAL